MNSEKVDNNAAGSTMIATESVKPNRYEVYVNGEAGKLVNANLKTSSSQTLSKYAAGKSLDRENPQEKGITLHIKELAVPGKDNGNLNTVLTTQRPKSALSCEPSHFCNLFGVSLNQPLKYSRNALNVKDVMDKGRRSSCSDLTKASRASKN